MFDNPKKELERLEEELLAAEATDEEFDEIVDEIMEEFATNDESLEPPVRNFSNDYGKAAPEPSIPVTEYSDVVRSVPAEPPQKSGTGLKILICLECLGIAAIIAWWLLRIL